MSDVMTAEEVAELLRVSRPTLRKLIEKDGLPAIHLGRLWRFKRSAVLAWIESRGEADGRRSA